MPVEITITGADSALARFEALDARLTADPRPLFESVSEEWATEFREHFTELQSDWDPLSGTTIAERAKEGFGPEPKLIRTSGLLNSIGMLELTGDTLRVGTERVSARLLNFGGRTSPRSRYPDRPVPARPFVFLSREAVEDTLEMVKAFYFDEGSPLDA